MIHKNLKDNNLDSLKELVSSYNEKPFRAEQLRQWLFKKDAQHIDDMTDISKGFRETLKEDGYYIFTPEVVTCSTATDGTKKFLLKFEDETTVEAVLMPPSAFSKSDSSDEDDSDDDTPVAGMATGGRATLCVSSQAGCPLDCDFCMTAEGGKGRNLSLSEMMAQFYIAEKLLKETNEKNRISNVVLMGMGEPLLNLQNVVDFCSLITDNKIIGLANHKVTISTAGLIPELSELGEFAKSEKCNASLAVSLNATTDEQRDIVMPINKKYPIDDLIKALTKYPLKKKRYITIEYVLMGGFNDSVDDAKRLVKILNPLKCKVNLIPFNEYPGSRYKRPTDKAIDAFSAYLFNKGIRVMTRYSKGSDIEAACGQLKSKVSSTS